MVELHEKLLPTLPDYVVPAEAKDILDEAMILLRGTPIGEENARLILLMQEGKRDETRGFLREAAIRGDYAADLDQLNKIDWSKVPENARGGAKRVMSTRRSLLGKMIQDANRLAQLSA